MIKNVVLNISNILTHFGWREFLARLGFSDETIGLFYEKMIINQYWDQYVQKELTIEEVCEKMYNVYVSNKSGELYEKIQKDPKALEYIITSILNHFDELIRCSVETSHWIREVKENGYNVFVICNYQIAALLLKIKNEASIFALADGKIIGECRNLSYPKQESYEYILETYNLKAKECVYIDDCEENIDRAKSMGIKGIVFTDYNETFNEIKNIEQRCK